MGDDSNLPPMKRMSR
jgi:hypothetical protein